MYDLVWSQPMTKVAEGFGISDVALKKICDKHRVPTPARGYWAKKSAGKQSRPIPFHGTADPQHEHITIFGSERNLAPEVREILERERQRQKATPKMKLPLAAVAQMPPIQDVHLSVAATAKALRKAKPDREGVVSASGPGNCVIEVSIASVERVITILDALARGLEARGLTMELPGGHMRVAVATDDLTFSLIERIERRAHVPTVEEPALEERQKRNRERHKRANLWSFGTERAYPEFDFVRSGELSLQIENKYVGLRRNWADGRRQRLENLINSIVGGIVAYLAGVKARREEFERRERRWERERRLAELARAREEREEERGSFFKRLVAILEEVNELRPFVARLRGDLRKPSSGELARMLEWAEARLLRLEGELTAEGIGAALRERELFPSPDPLRTPEEDED
jgi:hypothetical protein